MNYQFIVGQLFLEGLLEHPLVDKCRVSIVLLKIAGRWLVCIDNLFIILLSFVRKYYYLYFPIIQVLFSFLYKKLIMGFKFAASRFL